MASLSLMGTVIVISKVDLLTDMAIFFEDSHTSSLMTIVMVLIIRKITKPNRSKVVDCGNPTFNYSPYFHNMIDCESKCPQSVNWL